MSAPVAALRSALALAFALVMLCSTQAMAQKAPIDPARLAAARDLMEVTGVSKQMDGMMAAMSKGFQKGAADAGNAAAAGQATKGFNAFLDKFAAYRQPMLDDFAALYAERFTAEEMKAVADFYRSGPGARFIAAMPELMQGGSQIGMKYAEKVQADLKNDKK